MNSRLKLGGLLACALAIASLAGALSASAKGFECPWRPADGGVQSSEVSKLLPTGDAFDDISRLNEAVFALRQRGVGAPLIIDALIANYCPVVAANSALDDARKTVKVVRFAGRIAQLVYALDSATEIILDVPLAPAVLEAIGIKARAAGISPEDWVASVAAAAAKTAP